MAARNRRSFLAALAGGTAALAGCLDGHRRPSKRTTDRELDSTDWPSSTTDGATNTVGTTRTDSPDRIHLEAIDDPTTVDGPVTVYPSSLREWLLQVARTGETQRDHDDAFVYEPEPVLAKVDHVRLESTDTAVDGTYEADVDGGTRYDLLVGASKVESVPDGATVTSVADLPAEWREVAEEAIEGKPGPRVYPETEIGEWVRESFFGGYFEYEGAVYRGTEVQQTDAAFFSKEVWYVLSLSPVSDGAVTNPVTLRLLEIEPDIYESLDPVLTEFDPGDDSVVVELENLPSAVLSFLGEAEFLLTHTTVFAVRA